MLGTDPQYQRTGAGSALVRWGMAKADEEGVALYLDATDGERQLAATQQHYL
jgi:GNAT superfamily N-acetyltransferase